MVEGVVINDIHFGVPDSARIYQELKQFKDFINNNKNLQFVVIAGDYFDRKLSVGDISTYYAISFFHELIEICKERKLILRVIQGTRSHDLNQLNLFSTFQTDGELNFRIINEVSTEELLPDFNVLYIPEEYPEDSESYYKEFKEGNYAAIFGHGTWDFISFDNQIEHGNRKDINSAPVFIYEEWEKSFENGFVSFGHIHSRHKYKNKIFYSGSFSRWDFSDRSARGFTHVVYDTDVKKYTVEFIDNEDAPKFDVFVIKDAVPDYENVKIEDLQVILNEQIKSTDNIVLELSGLSKENIEILKAQYKNNPTVKIKVSEKRVSLKESAEKKEEFEKYNYIIKQELPLAETIKRYIKEEYEKDVGLEKVKEVINNERK